jgi:hypothetical protein
VSPARASAEGTDTEAADRAQYRQAAQAINDKSWEEAHRLLTDLWNRKKTFDVAASLGQTEYQLHRPAAGARHLAFALAHVPPKEGGDIVRDLHAALDEIRKLVASVRISVNRPAATVSVDGEQIGASPIEEEVFVEPGRHVIEARVGQGPGEVDSKALDFDPGHQYSVDLTLAPPTPHADNSPPVGVPPPADSSSGIESRTIVLITGSVVTATLLGVGIGESIRAGNAADEANQHRADAMEELGHNCPVGSTLPACQALNSSLEERNNANQIATWCYVGAGVAAATTATLYFVLPHGKQKHAETVSRISIATTPHSGSVWFTTSF